MSELHARLGVDRVEKLLRDVTRSFLDQIEACIREEAEISAYVCGLPCSAWSTCGTAREHLRVFPAAVVDAARNERTTLDPPAMLSVEARSAILALCR
jgi:hypothetical protein